MLVTSSGARLFHDSTVKLAAARPILRRLSRDPYFCYKYQVHYLRNRHWKRLGNDLSGTCFGGAPTVTPRQAAEMLVQLSRHQCKEVRRIHLRLPYTEGNLYWAPFGLALLPAGQPVWFGGPKNKTLAQISSEFGLTVREAVTWLIEAVENE